MPECLCLSVHASVHTAVYLLFNVIAQVAIVSGLGAAPWVVKPVYGFLSDTVPIFGYRRRSYLIICGLLGEHPLETRKRRVYAFQQSKRELLKAAAPIVMLPQLGCNNKSADSSTCSLLA